MSDCRRFAALPNLPDIMSTGGNPGLTSYLLGILLRDWAPGLYRFAGIALSESGLESGNSVLIQVDGAHGLVRLSVTQAALGGLSVGSFVEIDASEGFAIALVTALELQTAASAIIAKVDLLGEVLHGRDGQVHVPAWRQPLSLGRAVRQADSRRSGLH